LFSILIVDDHAAIRAAVRSRLESRCSGFTVYVEAVDGLEAIEKARELKPDLILLDISAKPEGIDQVVECVRILLQLASAFLPLPHALNLHRFCADRKIKE